jgi:hypothetical protein
MYKFEQDGGAIHDDKSLFLYVIPYDAYGSAITDNIAYVQTWTKFMFKDP